MNPALALIALAALLAQPAAQPSSQPTPQPAPQPHAHDGPEALPPGFPAEHRLLGELAGAFVAKVSLYAGPDKPPVEASGTASRTVILGGRFLRDALDVSQAPTPFSLETTLGFNPDAKPDDRFELVRLSSAAFPTMAERGAFETSSKTFTFKGDHLIDGKRARTRTVLRLEAYTTQVLEVFVAYEDPADPAKVLTPEFKAYSVEYERIR